MGIDCLSMAVHELLRAAGVICSDLLVLLYLITSYKPQLSMASELTGELLKRFHGQ